MSRPQKAILGVLAVILVAMLIMLATLMIQSEQKRLADIDDAVVIDAINTRIFEYGGD